MSYHFSNVRFVSPERLQRSVKLLFFDDSGNLDVVRGGLRFEGRRQAVDFLNIRAIRLIRPPFPWVNFAVGIGLAWPLVLAAPSGAARGMAAAFLLVINVVGAAICLSTKCVLLKFADKHGDTRLAYFADGTFFGWGGLFGGTRQLFSALSGVDFNDPGLVVRLRRSPSAKSPVHVHPAIILGVLFGGLGLVAVLLLTAQLPVLREASEARFALCCLGGLVGGAGLGVSLGFMKEGAGRSDDGGVRWSENDCNQKAEEPAAEARRFRCANCGKRLKSPVRSAGQKARCTRCAKLLRIPR
jgi:hypothetical protein